MPHFWIRKKSPQRGFGIVEAVLYVGIVALLSGFVINTMFALFSSAGKARSIWRIALEGETATERVTRELRLANAVAPGSTLRISPSILTLRTRRSAYDDTAVEKRITITGSRLTIQENSESPEYLTSPNVIVQSFIASTTTTPHAEAVKIELLLESGLGRTRTSESFFNSAILRESYR